MDPLGKAIFDKICKLFRNAHAIARHSRPYTDFVWMCTLDDMKGVQIGNTYRNDKQCAMFIHHIAQAHRDEIKEMVAEAKFVSLICNGSTDNTHTEAELAHVRYCHQGSIKVHFFGVKILKWQCQLSSQITLLAPCGKRRLWELELTAQAPCWGKTMDLWLDRPELVAVHCSAHRNELAYKDAARRIQLYKKVDALPLSSYFFYRNSPPQQEQHQTSF